MGRPGGARGRTGPADASREYWADVGPIPLLSAEEERELPARVAAGDAPARARMVEANLRLVIVIAAEYAGQGVDLEDLIEEGNVGLLRAVEDYRGGRGARFGTYAGFWIRQSMRRAIMGQGRGVRLPARMLAILARWARATARLEQELGRPPAAEEVAEALALAPAQRDSMKAALRVRRLRTGRGHVDGEGESVGPLAGLVAREELAAMLARLGELSGRDAAVVRLRYGLDGEPAMTLAAVGRRLGICRERVRQIEAAALRRLAGD